MPTGFFCASGGFPEHVVVFTKYSTPEYTVVTTMTTQHTVLSQEMFHSSIRQMATMVEAVLILPDQAAAMTRPLSTAMSRRPVTANSRATTSSSAHAGIWCCSTNSSMAATTSSLSASGSMNLPKSDT